MIDLETIVQRRPDLVSADMDGDVVMLDVELGKYFGLNPVGATIWEAMKSPVKISAICAQVLESFDVSPDMCREDTLAILSDMHARGMVITTS